MSQEITINIKGPSELKLSITISLDKSVKDLKDAIAEKSSVEAERQRLIYSGRVLKDDDPLSNYKIQTNHTIHMVKGVARNTDTPAAPQPLPTMQAGQNPADPLTQLNGPMGHGVMAGFNPFAGMGLNVNDPNMLQGMMDSPQFLQQMSNMMSNPAVMEQILAADPNLSALGPEFRQFFQSDQFRQMVGNPEALRGMFQMASALRGGGGGGGPFGAPAAGVGAPNSFASLFAQAPTASGANTTATPAAGTTTTPSSGTAPSAGSPPPANPFGVVDPALIEQLLGGPGGAGAFGNPFIPFGAGSPAPAANLPPPEERFQVQLQQLAEMGFTNAQQNIRALLATGGNVQGAIEYILGGGGL